MSIFNPITPEEMKRFTHTVRFCGVVPGYLNVYTNEFAEANWIPEFVFNFFVWLYGVFILSVQMVNEDYDPAWSFTITGEINR